MHPDTDARQEELRQQTAMDADDVAIDSEDTVQEHEDMDREPEDALEEPVVAHAPVSPEMTAVPPTGLWPEGTVDDLRQRWNAIQLRFVDDPPAVANDLHALIGETMESLQTTLTQRRQEIDGWASSTTDTEELRQLVSRYRSLFESLTA